MARTRDEEATLGPFYVEGDATFEKVMKKDEGFPLSPSRCPLSCGTAR